MSKQVGVMKHEVPHIAGVTIAVFFVLGALSAPRLASGAVFTSPTAITATDTSYDNQEDRKSVV